AVEPLCLRDVVRREPGEGVAVIEHGIPPYCASDQATCYCASYYAFASVVSNTQRSCMALTESHSLTAGLLTTMVWPSGVGRHERATGSGSPLRNAPAELTSFVGRRNELAAVKRLLGAGRLVTLAGPGGVGKTRLAVRAAISV